MSNTSMESEHIDLKAEKFKENVKLKLYAPTNIVIALLEDDKKDAMH